MEVISSSSSLGILVTMIVVSALWLLVLYLIIKSAVSAANRKTEKYHRTLNNLYIEALKRQGVEQEKTDEIIKMSRN